ncbi:YfhO family protein [Caldibacillus thermoamylovorans]|uniref:YfhO family protein n=1 Tax=Caldibacillus thermoamylovorans TaxID=35841 RepID=UPI00203ABEC7|nr:YfhO family protein [Caldibacillus thermoamylovorans]MCM3476733.1 YfhO family protein [Caldibacillus thermoamylovorans]
MKKISKYNTYILSFFIPIFLFGGILVLFNVYPFGNQSTLMADQFSQYIQFYNHFYDVFKGEESLLYSWESGMGLNFWGTFTYYLSSPLSFTVLLFDRDYLPEAFIFMTLCKIGLSGLTISIYLKSLFKSKQTTIITFSVLYALMSFQVSYFFNIMWLDSIYLLPVVLLGIEKMLENKYSLFIISLVLLFISNFYMSYMVGIFVFIYFVIRYFTIKHLNGYTLIKYFLTFFLCTLLATGLSAFVIIPTYLQLKSNSLSSIEWNVENFFKMNLNFTEFIAKLYNGSIHLFDQPNVYGGILSLLLFPLFFLNKNIKAREKILYYFLFVILVLSFQIQGINIIWHAFQTPTGYTQRFAFLFTFLMIYLAYRVFINFEKERLIELRNTSFVNVAIIILLTAITPELMSMQKSLWNILLIIIFSFILYLKATSRKYQKLIHIVLLFFVIIDVGVNTYLHMRTLYSYAGYNFTRDVYNISTSGFEELIDQINKEDQEFFRINSMIRLTKNDSLRYDYKGMDNFNTISNGALHEFMNKLGYSTTLGPRSLTQNEGILSSDALLGFKYEITDRSISKHDYVEKARKGDSVIYQNKIVLPLGFMVSREQFYLTKEDNPFINQNIFLGGEKRYFSKIDPVKINYHNLDVTENDSVLYVKKVNQKEEGYIEYTFNIDGKKQFYTLLAAGKGFAGFGETSIYVNGISLGVYPDYHYDRVLDLGAFTNEKVSIKIVFSVPETQLVQSDFYTLDIPLLEERIKELRMGEFSLKNYSNTKVEGNINVDQLNTLFFSIPYDEGWKAKVDGKQVPIEKLGGFIGIDIDDKGTHRIELSFMPKGFILGCILSITSLLIIFIITVILHSKGDYIK